MSDNGVLLGYADFTHEVFCRLANQIHGHIHVMLEYTLFICVGLGDLLTSLAINHWALTSVVMCLSPADDNMWALWRTHPDLTLDIKLQL